MPLAVTHIILTIILIDLYRDYLLKSKKYFTLHTVMIGGIASLLPDIDIPIKWLLNSFGFSMEIIIHTGLTHSLLFGLFFLLPALIFLKKKKHDINTYFFVITFAVLFHIFLDYLLNVKEGIMFLWPFTIQTFKSGLLPYNTNIEFFLGLDAVILLLWLWHEEVRHKIKDFI